MKWKMSCVAVAAAFGLGLSALPASAADQVATIAVQSLFSTLDPYNSFDTLSQAVTKSFYEGLFEFDQNNKLIPRLATSWTVDSTGKIYTINLRKGVLFSDGTPFTAAAVKASLERVANPDNHLKRYGLYKNIDHVDVVNDYQAKVYLKEAFSAFINQLAHPSAGMISPAALQKYGKDIGFHPVGTGPFTLVKWTVSDGIEVKKNPNYWRKGYPKLDAIDWKCVPENNTRANMLVTGEADFAAAVPYELADKLKSNDKLNVVSSPSVIQRFVALNTRMKPLDNPKVRQALNYAVNKDALVKVAFHGYAIPAEGVLPQGIAYNVKMGPWPYNPAKARELLKEAGYPNGFETTLWSVYNHSTAQKIIQFLQQQFAQVGVKVSLRALEVGQTAALVSNVQNPDDAQVRMLYLGWSSSTAEADWALRPLLYSKMWPPYGSNGAYYKNDQVDAGLMKALATTDDKEKAKIYADVQKRIWNDAPWIFLVTEKNVYAHAKKFKDFYVMPDGNFFFEDAHFE